MTILALRTDQPDANVLLIQDGKILVNHSWLAHRQLAETIHLAIKQVLDEAKLTAKDIQAILVYQGPGSFTGLRIGISVANAVAYAYGLPIHAEQGADWLSIGCQLLEAGTNDVNAVPEYGSEPTITRPRR